MGNVVVFFKARYELSRALSYVYGPIVTRYYNFITACGWVFNLFPSCSPHDQCYHTGPWAHELVHCHFYFRWSDPRNRVSGVKGTCMLKSNNTPRVLPPRLQTLPFSPGKVQALSCTCPKQQVWEPFHKCVTLICIYLIIIECEHLWTCRLAELFWELAFIHFASSC